jgi:iron(III) transport system substrate-binding protein
MNDGMRNAECGVRRKCCGFHVSRFTFHVAVLGALLFGMISGCTKKDDNKVLIIYTSQDQVYAEPILKEFSQQTGIEARAVYDSEAVKTVGLANRLLAERAHPQCDVFWNNEELRTRQLAAQNIFRKKDPWRAFGSRSRQIVVNTNHVPASFAPRTLSQLTNVTWRGKLALAYPLFGTSATHFLAVRQAWGEARWMDWCRTLQANKPLLVDGNSMVVKLVGRGEAWIGLTDSDDIAAGQREGLPIVALTLKEDGLSIPNTVAVIRDAPHPNSAQRFLEYIQQPDVVAKLIAASALEGASTNAVTKPALQPDWDKLVGELEATTKQLKEIFLR